MAKKTLNDLQAHDCRWPIGDPRHAGFHFCGAPQATGRPYCEHHWSMSFDAAKPRPRQTASISSLTLRRAA